MFLVLMFIQIRDALLTTVSHLWSFDLDPRDLSIFLKFFSG
jgi:hypothetical protein